MRSRRLRTAIVASIVVLAAAVALLAGRRAIFQAAGWALVAEDPLRKADVIIVAIDAGGAGVLEAADLVNSGVANRVALFADSPDTADLEFLRRGVSFENRAARATRELRALGVARIEEIPQPVEGTENEGEVLPDWCRRSGLHDVIVVTSADHSRRLRRVLKRAIADGATRGSVRWSRYSEFKPEQWWWTRGGVRTEIIELQKLLLDIMRHPLA